MAQLRVKATIEQIEKTRRTQGAKEEMYKAMARACVEAVINRQWDILIKFPYFVRFKSKGFPKGILVEKTATANIYKVKVRKLLDWLHENGYSTVNTDDVMAASRNFERELKRLEREFEDVVPDNVESLAGDSMEDVTAIISTEGEEK